MKTTIDTEELTGKDIEYLIREHPDWVDKFNLNKLGKARLIFVIYHFKGVINKIINKIDLNIFTANDWADILEKHPDLIDKANLKGLSGFYCYCLLKKQPQLINKIDKENLLKITDKTWECLVITHPQLKEYRP